MLRDTHSAVILDVNNITYILVQDVTCYTYTPQVLRTSLAYSNKSRLETLDNRRCASLIQALQTLLQGASPLTTDRSALRFSRSRPRNH